LIVAFSSHESNVISALYEKGLMCPPTRACGLVARPHTIPENVWVQLLKERSYFLPDPNDKEEWEPLLSAFKGFEEKLEQTQSRYTYM